jgi:type I restriction enzyme, S subunit
MNVPMVKLSDLAELNPRPNRRPDPDEIVSFIPMADIDATCGTTSRGEDRVFSEASKGYTHFTDNDLLVAKITPCFENGKIAQARLDHSYGTGSTEFHVVRPDRTRLDDRFLLHFLRQPRIRIAGELRMTGSGGQRRVPWTYLADLQIPYLPLTEQKKIGELLDAVDALRAKRREAVTLLEELVYFCFRNILDSEDQSWKFAGLGEVSEISSGITKGRKMPTEPVREVPYLAVLNVQDKSLDLSTVKCIDATNAEIARYRLLKNDLLLTEGGDPDKLGRGTLWREELPECIHQNHIFRVRLRPDSGVEPTYLNWYVASDRGRQYFLRSAKQTTGIASINATQLRMFPLALPCPAVQQNFARQVDVIESQKRIHLAHLSRLDELFASLQHRAFRGELFESTPA